MVLKASNAQIESVALIRDLEKQYGSLANVPDDNKQLMTIRRKLNSSESKNVTDSFVIPEVVFKDEGREPIQLPSTKMKYKEAYQTMLRDNLRLAQACTKTGTAANTFRDFLNANHAITKYYQMTFKGRKLRAKTAHDLMNNVKKLGYRSTTENAVANHDLHLRIVLAPLLFSEPAPLKSR